MLKHPALLLLLARLAASTMQASRSSRSGWVTWCSVLAYAYSFVAFGLQVNLLGPTVSVLARKLGVVEADLGIIFTINGLASIVGAMPSGYLIDKMPGHLVLAAALALEVCSAVCQPRRAGHSSSEG